MKTGSNRTALQSSKVPAAHRHHGDSEIAFEWAVKDGEEQSLQARQRSRFAGAFSASISAAEWLATLAASLVRRSISRVISSRPLTASEPRQRTGLPGSMR